MYCAGRAALWGSVTAIALPPPDPAGGRPPIERGGLDGPDDPHVARAAADVARELLADLVLRRVVVRVEQRLRRHQEAGRAEPALETVVVLERLLQRMQLVTIGEALDRLDPRAVDLTRERQAGACDNAVDEDGARAAHALLAADVRPRQS